MRARIISVTICRCDGLIPQFGKSKQQQIIAAAVATQIIKARLRVSAYDRYFTLKHLGVAILKIEFDEVNVHAHR